MRWRARRPEQRTEKGRRRGLRPEQRTDKGGKPVSNRRARAHKEWRRRGVDRKQRVLAAGKPTSEETLTEDPDGRDDHETGRSK